MIQPNGVRMAAAGGKAGNVLAIWVQPGKPELCCPHISFPCFAVIFSKNSQKKRLEKSWVKLQRSTKIDVVKKTGWRGHFLRRLLN